MQFHVGPHIYTVVVTTKKLKGINGKTIEGQACEGSRTLKISHKVTPERRESVLRHEYYHAWLFDVPRPDNEEAAAQLHAMTSQKFDQDYAIAGGSAALAALMPMDEPEPTPLAKQTDLDYLHTAQYSQLDNENWLYFQALCKRRDIDIWSDQVLPKMVADYRTNTMRLKLIVTMELLRSRAHRSPQWAGRDKAVEVIKGSRIVSSEVTVYRMVQGMRCPITTVAKYEEFEPYAMTDWAAIAPTGWLEKCAESKSLRGGFSDEIGNMYSQEEMMRSLTKPKQPPAQLNKQDDIVDQPWRDDVDEYRPPAA